MVRVDNVRFQKTPLTFKASNSFSDFGSPAVQPATTSCQPAQDEFVQKNAPENNDAKKKNNLPLIIGGLVGIGAIAFWIIKAKNGHTKTPKVNNPPTTPPTTTPQISAPTATNTATVEVAAGAVINKIAESPKAAVNYIETLALGVGEMLGKKIDKASLSSVVDKKELTEILPKLSEQNYVYNAQNVEQGIFKADLHSHSNYSDGKGEVEQILNEVCGYADEFFTKTKEKFIFALTDHDGVDGVKKALGIIAENPEKFTNVRFVPGVELSYAHAADKSENAVEMSEVLAYCVNPFSEGLTKLLNGIHTKRTEMVKSFVNDLSTTFTDAKFSLDELAQTNELDLSKDTFAANLHWKVNHYGQSKLAIAVMAKNLKDNTEELYKKQMEKATLGKAFETLKNMGIISHYIEKNGEINELRKKYQPQINPDGTIKALGENTFEEIINAFSDEKEALLAFAHPYYITDKVHDPEKFFGELKGKSNGLIQATESYHQPYNQNISRDEINKINGYCEAGEMLKVGGRDNHDANLFKKTGS